MIIHVHWMQIYTAQTNMYVTEEPYVNCMWHSLGYSPIKN